MRTYTILIRCRDEIRWLPDLKKGIEEQSIAPSEVIFVDSGSVDGSEQFARDAGWTVVRYLESPFNYSRAINIGLEQCNTELVVILSAHCLFVNRYSVENLLHCMEVFRPAGVYGRQVPTRNSTAVDVRDLLTVFGRERQIFEKYPFFHNAFSLIQKSAWDVFKFDESLNGMEDRAWANTACELGHKIVYEPTACVYHEHGLNQSNEPKRALRVVRMLAHIHKNDVFYPSNVSQAEKVIQYSILET